MKKKLLALAMVLSLVAVLVAPMAALAGAGDTVVEGTFTKTATLTPPTGITIAAMTQGDNLEGEEVSGSVEANTDDWVLTVEDADQATNPGYMIEATTQAVTATSGTTGTGTIEDTALPAQADDYWVGWSIVCLDGDAANIGQVRAVTAYVSATEILTTAAFPAAVAATDTFTLHMPLATALLVGVVTDPATDIAGYQTSLQSLDGVVATVPIPFYINQIVTTGEQNGTYSLTLTFTATPGT